MKRIFLTALLILGAFFWQFTQIVRADTLKKYVSLAPSTTEILFALKLDAEIAGVSSYCNYPPEAKQKSKIGDFSRPNIEKILSLNPDYVFCTGLEQTPVINELKKQRIKVYVADPKNIEELYVSIKEIGEITGRDKAAQKLISGMREEIAQIQREVGQIPIVERPRVFVEIWHEPLTTAGKGSFLDEAITLAGGINIAHNARRAFSIFSPEAVIRSNPECIILAYMDKGEPLKIVGERLGWDNISAVKNNRVHNDIDPDILLRPGPRIVQGIKELNQRLYP
ncbi:MAG: cobalamin-binding protein [Candidatus Omnitrophota bacterium]